MASALSLFAGRDALAQYTDQDQRTYNELYLPQLLRLREIGLGMREGNLWDASSRAIEGAGRTFDSTMGSFSRDLERSGLGSATPGQNRRLSLARVIQQVDAGNRAAQGAKNAQRAAQTFGMQAYGDSVVAANQTLADIANKEADRDAQYRAARAGAKAADEQAGAALAAVALMMM